MMATQSAAVEAPGNRDAADLLVYLAGHGVTLALRDDQTLSALPAASLTDSLRQLIRENKPALVVHLQSLRIRARLDARGQIARQGAPTADLSGRVAPAADSGKFEAAGADAGAGYDADWFSGPQSVNHGSPRARHCAADGPAAIPAAEPLAAAPIATNAIFEPVEASGTAETRFAAPLPAVAPTTVEVHYTDACPDYCQECGNLDYYRSAGVWLCAWCVPQPIRSVTYYGNAGEPGHREFREHVPEFRLSSFFREWEIRSAWPYGWIPPRPCGPTVSISRALRQQIESED